MRTYSPKPQDIERRWYVIDASGAVLGRLASQVAAILRGKHKPIFAPHMDTGDHVIVVNARGVRLTGGKEAKKFAYRHSGYPGGLTAIQYTELLSRRPEYAVEKAIKGMLPKNRLGRAMARKLKVYAGPEHPHAAQNPQPLRLGEVPPWTGLPERSPAPAAAEGAQERQAPPAASEAASAARKPKARSGAASSAGSTKARATRRRKDEEA
ncbi:50S ribosomal protein L13 [bacterium HR12]|nr:50S ribosomal protein L13 [bacterium HR12]